MTKLPVKTLFDCHAALPLSLNVVFTLQQNRWYSSFDY